MKLQYVETAKPTGEFKSKLSEYKRAARRLLEEYRLIANDLARQFQTTVVSSDLVFSGGKLSLQVTLASKTNMDVRKVNRTALGKRGVEFKPRTGIKGTYHFALVLKNNKGFE